MFNNSSDIFKMLANLPNGSIRFHRFLEHLRMFQNFKICQNENFPECNRNFQIFSTIFKIDFLNA